MLGRLEESNSNSIDRARHLRCRSTQPDTSHSKCHAHVFDRSPPFEMSAPQFEVGRPRGPTRLLCQAEDLFSINLNYHHDKYEVLYKTVPVATISQKATSH